MGIIVNQVKLIDYQSSGPVYSSNYQLQIEDIDLIPKRLGRNTDSNLGMSFRTCPEKSEYSEFGQGIT